MAAFSVEVNPACSKGVFVPVFTPGRRWQPPYNSFGKLPLRQRILADLEKIVKGPLWGCRMCGNCILQETAFICAMECPKGIRNGPCGGSTSDHCYVDETRPCIWYRIYERAFKMGRQELLLEVIASIRLGYGGRGNLG